MHATQPNILNVLYLTNLQMKCEWCSTSCQFLSTFVFCSAHFCAPAHLYSFVRELPQPPAFDTANTTADA